MEADKRKLGDKAGIVLAEFVEDVEAYMKRPENSDVQAVLKRLEEAHQKYKFMEHNLTMKKSRLKQQIPEIKTSLGVVSHLLSKKGSQDSMETRFMLADQLYAKATIPPTDRVCLWLGANVMLEYSVEEANDLLVKNLAEAEEARDRVDEDLGLLLDQATTVEVNMARVYNWDVTQRASALKE